MSTRPRRGVRRTLATLLLSAFIVTTLGVVAASAHYDWTCKAYPSQPYASGDEIVFHGYGSCEDSNGHYQHQIACAWSVLQKKRTDGTWGATYNGDRNALETCRYNASHVGDVGYIDDFCANGSATHRAGTFRTITTFWARNERGDLVHPHRSRAGAERTIYC